MSLKGKSFMNEKKKFGYVPALLLIIPFFLMIVFFV